MFEKIETPISGCFEIIPRRAEDKRGVFVKTYHQGVFQSMQLETRWCEEYYSVSRKRVLRGLHFQLPPHDHEKLVYCSQGEVFDVVVDLRIGSPMYGLHHCFQLNSEKANMIYIPKGCAHGFYTVSEQTTMMYKVSTVYSPSHDAGLLWNSVGVMWPDNNPVMSDRDKAFIELSKFNSPFRMEQ